MIYLPTLEELLKMLFETWTMVFDQIMLAI